MEITGKLIAALPTRSGTSQRTGNSWMSREYIMEIPGQFTRHFAFTVFGEDRLKQFNLRKDEEVTVQFDIDAHEHNGRWYNSCTAYNVIRAGQQQAQTTQTAQTSQQQPAQANQAQPPQQQQVFDNNGEGSADDLPFDSRGVAA